MVETLRARVKVEGRVQGVFFRAETRRMARSLGLAGWVRNMGDGSVVAAFEGPRQIVEAAVEWCGHGPPSAVVENVDITWEEPAGEGDFQVLYR
jgi:acylphosphatase